MSQTEQGKAYRAREVQVAELTTLFLANMSAEDANKAAEATVQEIETRNAEEQCRKDAEIAGYIPANTPNFFALSEAAHTSTAMHKKPFPGDVPVYYSANVAALEARVKVLETALKKADEFITNGIEFGFIRMPDSDMPDSALDTPGIIRAALTREGGK